MAQARGAPGLNRFWRLGAALAIPIAGAATLLIAVAITHRASPPKPVVVASPTPTPEPTQFPDVLSQFDLYTLGAPQSYGRLVLPEQPEPSQQLTVQPLGQFPAQLPVWRFTPEHIDPRAIADRFGIPRNDGVTQEKGVTYYHAGLAVDPSVTTILWQASGVASPQLGGIPRDDTSAGTLATRWLLRAGLAPFTGTAAQVVQTSNGESASFAEWTVTWPRVAREPGATPPPIDEITARVSADGTLKQLDFAHPRVNGGSQYQLRSWQDAYRDAQLGHWYRAPSLVITSVRLVYATVQLDSGLYAIPMYNFGDGLVSALAGP